MSVHIKLLMWRDAKWTHKKLQKLENPLVCENVKCVPRQGVNHRQSVDLILQQRWYSIIQTGTQSSREDAADQVILETACYKQRLFRETATKVSLIGWRKNRHSDKMPDMSVHVSMQSLHFFSDICWEYTSDKWMLPQAKPSDPSWLCASACSSPVFRKVRFDANNKMYRPERTAAN